MTSLNVGLSLLSANIFTDGVYLIIIQLRGKMTFKSLAWCNLLGLWVVWYLLSHLISSAMHWIFVDVNACTFLMISPCPPSLRACACLESVCYLKMFSYPYSYHEIFLLLFSLILDLTLVLEPPIFLVLYHNFLVALFFAPGSSYL